MPTPADRAVAALAAGKAHVEEHRSARGWLIRTQRAPVVKTSELSISEYSHGAWKRELGLTTVAGQSLPQCLFGGNSLELIHEASGVHISFCALEALRSWALLDHAPVPHLSPVAEAPQWEYTFTTAYPGAMTVEPVGTQPDGTSIYSRPAVNLASGKAQLRKPLCKCRGANSLAPLARLGVASPLATSPIDAARRPDCVSGPPPPEWQPTQERVDLARMMASGATPQLVDAIALWQDNLDPHSFASLEVHVFVCEAFWLAYLRCFVRVNGVMARVIDTRFVCTGDDGTVVRERSWREGPWEAFAGPGAPNHVDFGGNDDRVAVERLPLTAPPITEVLVLPRAPLRPSASLATAAADETLLAPAWARDLRCALLCPGGSLVIAAVDGGVSVEAMDAATGASIWQRAMATDGEVVVSAAAAPCTTADGGRVALGTSTGRVLLWWAATGEPLASFAVSAAASDVASGRRESMWVERLAWSDDGRRLAAAAGRDWLLVRTGEGGQDDVAVEASGAAGGTVYALAFAPGSRRRLAIGAYGGVTWAGTAGDDGRLALGAAAVLSMAMSPDGRLLAAGCLDKRVRLFALGDDDVKQTPPSRDWIGFEGPVRAVAWSRDGSWLAAAGGRTLLVVPRHRKPGEAPTMCMMPPAASGGAARCEAFAWCPNRDGVAAEWLVVLDAQRRAHIFCPRMADQAVPRRAAPLMTLEPLDMASRLQEPSQPQLACASGPDGEPRLLISRGDRLECLRRLPA